MTPLSVAVIVVTPHPVAVATPLAVIVATLGVLEVHVAVELRFSGGTFLWFVVPIAINCVVCPIWVTLAFCGVTAIETKCLLLQLPVTSKVHSAKARSAPHG